MKGTRIELGVRRGRKHGGQDGGEGKRKEKERHTSDRVSGIILVKGGREELFVSLLRNETTSSHFFKNDFLNS